MSPFQKGSSALLSMCPNGQEGAFLTSHIAGSPHLLPNVLCLSSWGAPHSVWLAWHLPVGLRSLTIITAAASGEALSFRSLTLESSLCLMTSSLPPRSSVLSLHGSISPPGGLGQVGDNYSLTLPDCSFWPPHSILSFIFIIRFCQTTTSYAYMCLTLRRCSQVTQ